MISHTIYFDYTFLLFVMQTIKFIVFRFVCSLNNTFGLNHMPLSFQMNINKDLSENGKNLDHDVLYNFEDTISHLMREDGVTPWRGR